jgi:hypothetical protein
MNDGLNYARKSRTWLLFDYGENLLHPKKKYLLYQRLDENLMPLRQNRISLLVRYKHISRDNDRLDRLSKPPLQMMFLFRKIWAQFES